MRKRVQVALAVLAVMAVAVAGCAPLQAGPNEKTIHVGPYLVDCEGVAPQKCMLVKENPEDEWTYYYDQIEGFVYEEGFEYKLRIMEEEVENPPADASTIRWVLVEVLDESRSLEGTLWILDSYMNDEGVLDKALPGSEASAEFREGRVAGSASCNSYFGNYKVDGDDLSVELGGMTEMYCAPEELMAQEQDYLAALGSAASYTIVDDLLQIEFSDGTPVLTYSVLKPQPLVGTVWQLNGYNNSKGGFTSVLNGTEITALFAEDGRLGGSAGCNNYATSYDAEANAISIGPVASTMMACPEPEGVMEQESAYLAALEGAAVYEIEGDTLSMRDNSGTVLVSYVAQEPISLEGTAWQMISYNNGQEAVASALAGTEITASFGDDGQLTGSAGCNNYFASYETDGDQIEIGPAGSTMMMCNSPKGIMDQEGAYLAALDASTHYSVEGDQLRMTDGEGVTMLTFAPLESSPLAGTLWQVETYDNGKLAFVTPLPGTQITAIFGEEGSLGGSAGCNNYTAAYEVSGNEMTIGPAASTMMACQAPPGIMEQEGLYLEALGLVAGYRIQGSRLELTNAEGQTKITYTEVEPMNLAGMTWDATGYNNGKGGVTTLLAGTQITALFGEDGNVTGSASCNNYSAAYEVSGDSISIGPAASTRMFCSEPEGIMEQEAAYLAALQAAATFRIEGERLEMWDAGGSKQTDYVAANEASGTPDQALANMEYQSQFTASGTAPLTDGEYREQAAPGSATETVVMLTEHVVTGELNGQQAAAVVLVTDPGGSGTFYDLAVVVEQNGEPVNVAITSLGDRVQINSIAIEGNEIIVDMVQPGPDDPMCCPTQHVIKTYALEGDELAETSSQIVN